MKVRLLAFLFVLKCTWWCTTSTTAFYWVTIAAILHIIRGIHYQLWNAPNQTNNILMNKNVNNLDSYKTETDFSHIKLRSLMLEASSWPSTVKVIVWDWGDFLKTISSDLSGFMYSPELLNSLQPPGPQTHTLLK